MLGGFAVGKSSLVRRFVHSLYSERYHTSIGVKVEKKVVAIAGGELSLMLWDIHGEDELQKIRLSYLRGTAGYLLVVDGTRRETLATALALQRTVEAEIGAVPFVLALNKSDLISDWDLDEAALADLERRSVFTIRTSARTGQGVQEAFERLAAVLSD